MADKQYYIKISGQMIEVTKEVYREFRYMERHMQTLEEKDERHRVISYNALDTDETLGEEAVPDLISPSVEDQAIAGLMAAKLRRCLALLPEDDRRLIQAIYYEGLSERELSEREGVPQTTINYRRNLIVQKLRKMFGV